MKRKPYDSMTAAEIIEERDEYLAQAERHNGVPAIAQDYERRAKFCERLLHDRAAGLPFSTS